MSRVVGAVQLLFCVTAASQAPLEKPARLDRSLAVLDADRCRL